MSKKKKKILKKEKLKTWCIHTNGSTLSGNFNNVPVYDLIEVLEGFIPHETEEERLKWIKNIVEPSLLTFIKNIPYDEIVQHFSEAKEPRPSSATK